MSKPVLYQAASQCIGDIVFSAPKDNVAGGKSCYAQKTFAGEALHIQLCRKDEPWLTAPFGVSTMDKTKKDSPRKSLELSTGNQVLLDTMKKLDDHAVQLLTTNSLSWLGKVYSQEQIKAMYTSIVRYPDNESFNPTIRVRFNSKGSYAADIERVQPNNTIIAGDYTLIQKNSRILPIVKVSNIWISSGKFGVTLELTKCLVSNEQEKPAFQYDWGDEAAPPVTDILCTEALPEYEFSLAKRGEEQIGSKRKVTEDVAPSDDQSKGDQSKGDQESDQSSDNKRYKKRQR